MRTDVKTYRLGVLVVTLASAGLLGATLANLPRRGGERRPAPPNRTYLGRVTDIRPNGDGPYVVTTSDGGRYVLEYPISGRIGARAYLEKDEDDAVLWIEGNRYGRRILGG